MKNKIILFALLLYSLTSFSAPPDLNGRWLGRVGDEFDFGLALKTDGSKVTGTLYTPDGEGPISNGKISKNTLTFSYAVNGKTIPYTGTLADNKLELSFAYEGEEIKGTLSRIGTDQPIRITPRMRPQMSEYWEPVPKIVDPGPYPGMVTPPSDAVVLFDGKDLSKWKSRDGSGAKWKIEDGSFTVVKGTGDITTQQKFGDYQLHIEWKIPVDIQGQSQARGNSGIFLQDLSDDLKIPGYWYEVQVLDNYNSATYVNGQAGSIYKQNPPLVNAMRKPGEWNVYDITYTEPRFNENGTLFSPARVTVIHNGIVVQNNFAIRGHTAYIGHPYYYKAHGKGPISLQDHGDPSKAISFRNIWLREL